MRANRKDEPAWISIPSTAIKLRTTIASKESVSRVWESFSPHSYFLSLGWIGNLLDTLPENISLNMVELKDGNGPVCGFLMGTSRFTRRFPFIRRSVSINTTGRERYDKCLWIEYNSIPSIAPDMNLFQILDYLPGRWHDIVLPGLDSDSFPGNCFKNRHEIRKGSNGMRYKVAIQQDLPSFYVDLTEVRRAGGDVSPLLTSSHRTTLKRSNRLYQDMGTISLQKADSPDSALAVFREMLDLHKESFSRRSRRSNFITRYSIQFHEALIKSRFSSGEMQLLRITSGDHVLGCLYNFIYGSKVYCYQSGLAHFKDNRLKPGLTCHSEAIRHNASLGHDTYDFLAGDEPYKTFFTNRHNTMIWVRIEHMAL